MLLNPILLTIATLILYLKCADISYETYSEGGELIAFWLKPAVVALGVPLYLQLEMIKKQWMPILLSQLVGKLKAIASLNLFHSHHYRFDACFLFQLIQHLIHRIHGLFRQDAVGQEARGMNAAVDGEVCRRLPLPSRFRPGR